MEPNEAIEDAEIDILVETILRIYGYDFRHYARASLKRRATQALPRFSCETISELQRRVVNDPAVFPRLLSMLTVPVCRTPGIDSFIRFRVRKKVDLPHPEGPINAVT